MNKVEKKEIWKDIKGYEGLYQVSNLGNIKSLDRNINNHFVLGKQLKSYSGTSGYLFVRLSKNNKYKNFIIHRIVAETFIENPNNYNYVNHKDEDKINNNVCNLEWCSQKYNCNYGNRNKKISQKNTNGKCSKRVEQYIKDGTYIRTWISLKQIQRELNYNIGNIGQVCLGNRITANGYRWKYENN